jgi:hypothetical protein
MKPRIDRKYFKSVSIGHKPIDIYVYVDFTKSILPFGIDTATPIIRITQSIECILLIIRLIC